MFAAATWLTPIVLRAARREIADVPWLAEIQKPPAIVPSDVPNLSPLLKDKSGAAISTLEQWKNRREELRKQWLEFLGPLKTERLALGGPTLIREDRIDDVVRQLLRYDIEDGVTTEAYLLKHEKPQGRRPGIVLLHSTVKNSIEHVAAPAVGRGDAALGPALAKRGYIVICPRNFLWSDNQTMAADAETKKFLDPHPGAKGMARMLFDAQRATDILAHRDDVDPDRLGAVGHSLGAKEVLYLAAFDQRIRATVFSEGGIGIGYSNWDAPWYLGPAVHQKNFAHEHHELLALVAPRAFLILGGDSADGAKSWPFIDAALPVYRLYAGRPRIGLFNHKQGHAIPNDAKERLFEWLRVYL